MHYLIGDLQGCCSALDRLLETIGFSASRDRLYVLGDLVNRGPQSLATLQRLRGLGDAAVCLLGNHDWHLLAVAYGARPLHRDDTLTEILEAPDREAWIDWLRGRRMALHEDGWLMVHAGVAPQWDRALTLQLAGELEARLQSPDLGDFLRVMYGNQPARWSDDLQGDDRLRLALNTLTRIPPRPARPGHGLRLGRPAQRDAHRRRPPRTRSGRMRAGAAAGVTGMAGRQHRTQSLACAARRYNLRSLEAWQSGRLHRS